MNENEENFEALRRLLSLKRHEIPPPGYFNRFSGEVIARIRAGDGSAQGDLSERLPWLFRLIQAFEAKPAFAGVFASALCVTLLVGIGYAERPDVTFQPIMPVSQNSPSNPSANIASVSAAGLSAQPALQGGFISSTNPVFNASPMNGRPALQLFGDQNAFAQPVSFTVSGN